MGFFSRDWLQALAKSLHEDASCKADGLPTEQPAKVCVAFASETGVAEDLAHDTRALIEQAGVAVELLQLNELGLDHLKTRALTFFLVSTTGNGDAPDMAWEFLEGPMQTPADLTGVSCAVLALGDKAYPDFCQFGNELAQWLLASGASLLSPCIRVDDEEDEALQKWQQLVTELVKSGMGPIS